LKFRELKKSLGENLELIYLIEGEDAFLRENALRLIKQKALSEPDLNLTNFSGADVKGDLEEFLSAVQSYPFMGEKRYVVVRDYYPTAQELKGKVLKKVFLEPCDTTCLVIVNKDKCEALKKLQTVTLVDCQKADEMLISSWVRSKCKENNVTITQDALTLLIEYCSSDMARISGETEKLICFVTSGGEISKDTINALVSKDMSYQIYEFTECIAKRNYDKSFEMLSDLLTKNQDKQRLFIALYYHFRRLLHVSISSLSASELASSLDTMEFVIKKAKEQASKFKVKRLKQICDKLSYYDGAFKSGELSVDTALWNSILNTMVNE
jgi:DNA polymerase-3 subunit delta